jgi:hypothetical protein
MHTYLFLFLVKESDHLDYKIGRKSANFCLLLVLAVTAQFCAVLLHFFGQCIQDAGLEVARFGSEETAQLNKKIKFERI